MFQNPHRSLLCFAIFLFGCDFGTISSESINYLPLDDTEYPYAGLPRLVIETEKLQQISDSLAEIQARLQVYGKNAPETEVYTITLKGHGNSSFNGMPKPSYKVDFSKNLEFLGMPREKDWVLLANFADRSHLKNFITFKLYSWLGAPWSPRAEFVEVFLNRKYQGLYLATEKIKRDKFRVNLPKSGTGFLAEYDDKYDPGEKIFLSRSGVPLHIKYPKDISDSAANTFIAFYDSVETIIKSGDYGNKLNKLEQVLDIEAYLRFFWIQEFSKNHDGYGSSTYFTWIIGNNLNYGPIWDMDLAYGEPLKDHSVPGFWFMKHRWNKYLLANTEFKERAYSFWEDNLRTFSAVLDSIPLYAKTITRATDNEFKRWPTLENTENWTFYESYESYNDAVDALRNWIKQRIDWITREIQ